MDTIIEIVGEFFEFIIEFIEIKLYKRKNRDEDNDSNVQNQTNSDLMRR